MFVEKSDSEHVEKKVQNDNRQVPDKSPLSILDYYMENKNVQEMSGEMYPSESNQYQKTKTK